VRPPLEHAAVGGEQLVEHFGRVVRQARPERVVVGALDDVDGVNLDVAELLNGLRRALFAGRSVGAAPLSPWACRISWRAIVRERVGLLASGVGGVMLMPLPSHGNLAPGDNFLDHFFLSRVAGLLQIV
jgi:hypothetical protein